MSLINIGLAGAGTIGGGVVTILSRQAEFFARKLGAGVALKRIADVDASRFAALPVGSALCTSDARDILCDPQIQILIELIGGVTFARELILEALSRKKHVITANKALLAEHGPEIFAAAEKNGVSVHFEAAVGGGMPVIKALREALVGNEVTSVKTIINGTCNYILTQMSTERLPFAKVLAAAQRKGYAEADPSLDVNGGDAGHKLAIMASLLYGGYLPYRSVSIEGITGITPQDLAFADELGYCIKLLGIINRAADNEAIDVRVHPAMLRKEHILASVSDVYNAVWLHGDAVGEMLMYGRGAGAMPTASAVMSDIIDVARNIAAGSPQRIRMDYYAADRELAVKPLASLVTRYYLCFTVLDRPGVLASLSRALGERGISIASVLQKEAPAADVRRGVPVIILTHRAQESSVQQALAEIEKMDFVNNRTRLIRIEE